MIMKNLREREKVGSREIESDRCKGGKKCQTYSKKTATIGIGGGRFRSLLSWGLGLEVISSQRSLSFPATSPSCLVPAAYPPLSGPPSHRWAFSFHCVQLAKPFRNKKQPTCAGLLALCRSRTHLGQFSRWLLIQGFLWSQHLLCSLGP